MTTKRKKQIENMVIARTIAFVMITNHWDCSEDYLEKKIRLLFATPYLLHDHIMTSIVTCYDVLNYINNVSEQHCRCVFDLVLDDDDDEIYIEPDEEIFYEVIDSLSQNDIHEIANHCKDAFNNKNKWGLTSGCCDVVEIEGQMILPRIAMELFYSNYCANDYTIKVLRETDYEVVYDGIDTVVAMHIMLLTPQRWIVIVEGTVKTKTPLGTDYQKFRHKCSITTIMTSEIDSWHHEDTQAIACKDRKIL